MEQNRYETFLKSIGANVRRIRKEKSLTMEEVAHLADVEFRQIGRVERGEVNATITSLLKIADALKVNVADFLPQTN